MDDKTSYESQIGYLEMMIGTPDVFALAKPCLKAEYFDKKLQPAVTFILDFVEKNRGLPSRDTLSLATKLKLEPTKIEKHEVKPIAELIVDFCRHQAVVSTLLQGPKLVEEADFEQMVRLIKEAASIELVSDVGIDYFDNPLARLERQEEEFAPISLGWRDVDEKIDGGVQRGDLVMLLAPSGGGKSVGMLNIACNFLAQGLSGVYISLEMGDRVVASRADAMIAGIAANKVLLNKEHVALALETFKEKHGSNFFITRMSEVTTTSSTIAAYLTELQSRHNFKPDFVVVDYLDILNPTRKVSMENMFLKDKVTAEELRAIGLDHNCVIISASQLGKHSTEKILDGNKLHQGDVQGGSSKTNTSDLMIGIVRTEEMMEAGECRFEFIKSRNSSAVGKTLLMKWNNQTLKISDGSTLDLVKKSGTRTTVVPGKKTSLLDL